MATGGGVKEVGVRLKVGATGLENATALGKSLRDLGVDTTALDAKAEALGVELAKLGSEQRLIDTFVRTKKASADAAKALEDAQAAAQKLGRELAQAEAPTKAQTAALEKARTAVTGAKDAYTAQRLELQQQRTALQQAGISSDGLAAAQVRVRQQTDAAKQAAATLTTQYHTTAEAAKASGATQQVAAQGVGESVRGLGNQLRTIQTLASAAIGGQLLGGLAGQVTQAADAYQNLQARIKLVTGEGQAFDTAFQGVFDIATRTNSSLEATGNLFTRIAQAGAAIGRTQQDSLALTETINQAIQLSGGSAQSADAAITQLVQGLQGGVLRGDEFNSIMEQSPRLAKALADGLSVSTGELRKMAEQGQLTSDTVIRALEGQSAAVQREFEKLPPTVGRALQNLSSEWTRYVGETDKANGITATAATAIGALSRHLNELGTALAVVGQAYLAYKAFDLAVVFLAEARATQVLLAAHTAEAATRAAATASTAAHTAALAANTVAKGANAAAAAGMAAATSVSAAASVGATAVDVASTAAVAKGTGTLLARLGVLARFAGVIGLVATGIAVAGSLFVDFGRWVGGAIARLAGFELKTIDLTVAQKDNEAAARATAQAQAELAQKTARAEEATLGLTKQSRAIVAAFDDVVTKGGSVAEALEKVTKELQLGEPTGITNAVTALDVLERKGKITADQVRAALASALDGKDLAIFATNAKTAFDKSEQGARRLKVALDAVADEALKRAGTSVQELQGGFSKAMNSAINDTDALVQTLGNMGIKGEQAAQLVGKSLDKEIAAANTERAIKAVTDRVVELGRQGTLSGQQVTEALTKIETKAGQLKNGVNTLAEALAILGIKSKEKLDQVAADSRAAFEFAEQSGKVSIGELIKAFNKMRDDAIAANNGIEPSWIRQKQLMLESRASAAGLGSSIVQAMLDAKKATDAASTAQEQYNKLLRDDPSRLVGGNGLAGFNNPSANTPDGLPKIDSFGNLINSTKSGDITRTAEGPQAVSPGDGWTYTLDPAQIVTRGVDARGNPVPGGWMRTPQPNRGVTGGDGFAGLPTFGTAGAAFNPADPFGNTARAADSGASYTVNVTIGGVSYGIAAASKKAADDMILALERAYQLGGGGG